jgi:hypothetical protein
MISHWWGAGTLRIESRLTPNRWGRPLCPPALLCFPQPFARDMMHLLFAHHDMLEVLDVLGLNPVTPLDHALALATYVLLALVVFLGLKWAGRRLFRRVRPERIDSEPLPIATPRTLEG